MPQSIRPGGKVDSLPLHFVWIADCSMSMAQDGKIQSLNQAIREAVPHMRRVDDENPRGRILVRSLAFDTNARWHQGQPVDVHSFQWKDLQARGKTAMGAALEKVGRAFEVDKMPQNALPPVLVLVSDGQPTDSFKAGYREMMSRPWCQKAVRMAISIGRDADEGVLRKFIGRGQEVGPLQANNPEQLAEQIEWVSTEVVRAASAPKSRLAGQSQVGSSGRGGQASRPGSTGTVLNQQLTRQGHAVSALGEGDKW